MKRYHSSIPREATERFLATRSKKSRSAIGKMTNLWVALGLPVIRQHGETILSNMAALPPIPTSGLLAP
jgi:hypothetical protein